METLVLLLPFTRKSIHVHSHMQDTENQTAVTFLGNFVCDDCLDSAEQWNSDETVSVLPKKRFRY